MVFESLESSNSLWKHVWNDILGSQNSGFWKPESYYFLKAWIVRIPVKTRVEWQPGVQKQWFFKALMGPKAMVLESLNRQNPCENTCGMSTLRNLHHIFLRSWVLTIPTASDHVFRVKTRVEWHFGLLETKALESCNNSRSRFPYKNTGEQIARPRT